MNLPGQPKVEDIKWPSEYGAVFPGRVYSLEQNGGRYSVTVIDYTDAERIHAARTNHTEADSLPIYWQVDVQASIAYAATKFRQRPGVKVTYDAFHYIDLVSGHQLQITNPDQSRTFAGSICTRAVCISSRRRSPRARRSRDCSSSRSAFSTRRGRRCGIRRSTTTG